MSGRKLEMVVWARKDGKGVALGRNGHDCLAGTEGKRLNGRKGVSLRQKSSNKKLKGGGKNMKIRNHSERSSLKKQGKNPQERLLELFKEHGQKNEY